MSSPSFTTSSSFPRRYRDLGRTDTDPAIAPTTTTTVTALPTPSPPQQPGIVFSGGTSPSLVAALISIGAFAVAIFAICAWCKIMRRRLGVTTEDFYFADRVLPARFRRRRGLGGGGGEGEVEVEGVGVGGQGDVHGRGRSRRWRRGQGLQHARSDNRSKVKPMMFDAWIEKGGGRIADNTLKWEAEESVPLSATLFTTTTGPPAGPCMADVSSRAGGDSVEEEDEEKKCLSVQQTRQAATGSSTLQVAVLLQMPSPSSHTVREAPRNDIGVSGELAIGLVEASWTREHPSSREGEEITIS